MNVSIITIGDELLIGQVVDTNSAWMGQLLNQSGFSIDRILSIGDTKEEIIENVNLAMQSADIILCTGGLGPTKDDITKHALAEIFDTKLVYNAEVHQHIEKLFERFGRKAGEAHRIQSFLPEAALLLKNKMGTAPGMWLEQDGKVLISMPGVPYEMKYILEHEALPRLKEKFEADTILHRTLRTAGIGESMLNDEIVDIEEKLPAHIKLAFLPSLGHVRLRLTARGSGLATEDLQKELDAYGDAIKERLNKVVYAEGDTTLEEAVGILLQSKNKTVGTAESCTGGYVAHLLTSIPGSSSYFMGSTVTYSYEMKKHLLDVQQSTLEKYGAVSEEVVREMALGALKQLQTDYTIALSGIMGPGGGTEDKPVGTIWIAVASAKGVETQLINATKDRGLNIQFAANRALTLLWKVLNQGVL